MLSGHKHVPYAWRLENLFVVNAGTVSTTRLRGKTKPCYNVIEASPERVTVFRKYPFHEQDAIISFDPRTYEYEKDQSLLGRDGARLAASWRVAVIALIDGEHHPAAVRDALDAARPRRRGLLRRRGEARPPGSLDERLRPAGRDRSRGRRCGAWRRRAEAVVDLADEPVLPPSAKLRLAALALHLGLRYEAPGLRLDPPRYAPVAFDGPKLAVIGTGKRTGKTAVAGHWAGAAARAGVDPVIVCMGRGGPARADASPTADTGLDDLLAIADGGGHAASDYLEDAVLARRAHRRLPARRRRARGRAVGVERARRAPRWRRRCRAPGALIFEGSGVCIPPVEVDRTVCVIGPGEPEPLRGVPRCCGRSCCWPTRTRAAPPRRAALLAAPRAGRAAARRRAGGAVHHRRAARARASSRSWPRPTWPAAPRWPPTWSGPPPRAATST